MSCSCGKETSCGCGDAPQMLYMADEFGQSHPFYIADRLQVNNCTYVFLVSTEDSEQFALLKVLTDEAGKESYVNITDEAEWEQLEQSLFDATPVK